MCCDCFFRVLSNAQLTVFSDRPRRLGEPSRTLSPVPAWTHEGEYKCQNSLPLSPPSFISGFFPIPVPRFPSIDLPWRRRADQHSPKAREVFSHCSQSHPWMPALDQKFSSEKKKKKERKKDLFSGPSGNDLNLRLCYFDLIHQSCLCTLQTATGSSSHSSHILAAESSFKLLQPHQLLGSTHSTFRLQGFGGLPQKPEKTCSQTQGGLMFIFLKSDFLTLLPSASNTAVQVQKEFQSCTNTALSFPV